LQTSPVPPPVREKKLSRLLVRAASGLVLVLALLTGCERLSNPRAAEETEQAEQKLAAGDPQSAVLLYEAALDGTADTAEIHFKLALIYDDHLQQPISALHHFRRYLALAPAGPYAKEARKFADNDELKLAASLGGGASLPQDAAVRLKNDNLTLRKQNLELRAQLEAAKKTVAALQKSSGIKGQPIEPPQEQKPLVPGVRTYTVERGDTLASISRKFYKTPARWKQIQDANFNAMKGTAKLRPGMMLMVPE
jgi:nucleoid-associated protein YgaU